VLAPISLAAAALLTGCGGSQAPAPTAKATTAAAAPARGHSTVWLCFPGKQPDPCGGDAATTIVRGDGTTSVEVAKAAASPAIDCFYVYPTVSLENTGNADLKIQLPETLVAVVQASRFSQVCRVYAPVYRQITDRGLANPALHASPAEAYSDVLAAWKDYLAHDNHGRGVVLIGHSQGAYALKQLVKTVVDRSPAERRLLVSAILLGGQVLAGNSAADQGDFAHVPPCASITQTGCVIAYSTFDGTPPPNARFGRDDSASTHVLCVNPASPSGGSASITPLFPANVSQLMGGPLAVDVKTSWVAFPGLYTARCERSGTASWLQIDHKRAPGDRRPIVRPLFGPGWGLHGTDVNIALADLVALVGSEARAYAAHG
jgi:Protein of unknown function (DUF3089)